MRIRAALSEAGHDAPELTELDLEEPRAGEMRVRIAACGICHTDLHAQDGRLAPLPIVLGHEGAGVVEKLGEGVSDFAVGDHVLLSGSSCGTCPSCEANLPSYCDTAMPRTFGGGRMDRSTALSRKGSPVHSHFFGQSSFASHAIVPQRTAVKLPKDVPLEMMAPLGCGIITGAGTVIESLALQPGQSVAVFGTGGVGLSAVMAARLIGASRIVAVDLSPQRLELARELGATDCLRGDQADLAKAIRAITGRGMDASINTTVAPPVFDTAMECLAMRGTAAFVTAPRGEWQPPMFPMLAGGRSLKGVLGGDAAPRRFIPMLVDFWRQGRFPFDRLLTFYPFEEIGRAFEDARQGRVIKPVLTMADAIIPDAKGPEATRQGEAE
ncbi:aryl-alcohol dehydrogenase [Altererythrobacter atlanticus]|uniref:Aryl-alcohol dehydrogenase n=1 Tax=Croceibacterium atlanticum TaxID=1267766 RepID=A0A0F7KYP6_9SPHN|nr:NAD(P)-dependent alcohol dehydrogenase [Croceibacterium atlanticum]AKH43925.1 Aryl-alcohol dehydrogenase [Croceibacterium atlanticum]MBB5733625.1 aryl-alcohol dehydrogenase [Croceibacterium atlanticum]